MAEPLAPGTVVECIQEPVDGQSYGPVLGAIGVVQPWQYPGSKSFLPTSYALVTWTGGYPDWYSRLDRLRVVEPAAPPVDRTPELRANAARAIGMLRARVV
jgi:hypothetical protein